MTEANVDITPGAHAFHQETVDVLDLLFTLSRAAKHIAWAGVIGLGAGALLAFVILKPTYTASAIILPPQQAQSSASALLGSLGALSGMGTGLGLKSPADMYVGMLESRTVADNVIEQFHLQSLYKERTLDEARVKFGKKVKIEASKDGLIHIDADAPSPKLASEIANAVVDQLYHLNATIAITEAGQRRIFFEQQVEAEKKSLAGAEDELRATEEKTGVIQLSGQAESIIRNVAQLQAEIASSEVALRALHAYATDQNAASVQLEEQIAAMQEQLRTLENKQQALQPGDPLLPFSTMPQAALEYTRKLRNFRFHETMYELLTRQYQAARIDEAKSAPLIQVVDHAVPPQVKSGPKKLLIVLAAGFLGMLLQACVALMGAGMERLYADEERSSKLRAIREALQGVSKKHLKTAETGPAK